MSEVLEEFKAPMKGYAFQRYKGIALFCIKDETGVVRGTAKEQGDVPSLFTVEGTVHNEVMQELRNKVDSIK